MSGISPTQNQQKYFSPKSPNLHKMSCHDISYCLKKYRCNGCGLNFQVGLNGPIVYRGNLNANKMIIGEGPGKVEDQTGIPFSGPAGQLLDKIFSSVGLDTNDWYLTNVLKCRPIAKLGYKENFTPTSNYIEACKPFIKREIEFIKPKVILLLGKTAVSSLLPSLRNQPMSNIVGKTYTNKEYLNSVFFIMYHPAYLLHSKGYIKNNNFNYVYDNLRKETWNHINKLKIIL